MAVRALFKQARETGKLEQVKDLRKTDPAAFKSMVLEFRSTYLACVN